MLTPISLGLCFHLTFEICGGLFCFKFLKDYFKRQIPTFPRISLAHVFIYQLVIWTIKVASKGWKSHAHELGPRGIDVMQIHRFAPLHVR